MVRILEFRRDLHRLSNLAEKREEWDEDEPLGEIIIFPGVRVERYEADLDFFDEPEELVEEETDDDISYDHQS